MFAKVLTNGCWYSESRSWFGSQSKSPQPASVSTVSTMTLIFRIKLRLLSARQLFVVSKLKKFASFFWNSIWVQVFNEKRGKVFRSFAQWHVSKRKLNVSTSKRERVELNVNTNSRLHIHAESFKRMCNCELNQQCTQAQSRWILRYLFHKTFTISNWKQ